LAINIYAEDGLEGAETSAMLFLAKVVALEAALIEVCNQLKVDVVAIKTMAGCPVDDALPSELLPVDAVLTNQYIELFT